MYFLLLARDLNYLSDKQHQDLKALVDDASKPLYGLVEAVRKEAGA